MRVLVLLALISAVSARCNNVLKGVCGQNSFSGPYNIFNNRQSYSTAGAIFEDDVRPSRQISGSCFHTKAVPLSLKQIYNSQPLHYRVLSNEEQHLKIDNICATFFPLPDDPNTYTIYEATVYCDGSYTIETAVISDISIGTSTLGSATATSTRRFFGQLDENMYVGCSYADYGDLIGHDIFVMTQRTLEPIGVNCVEQIKKMIDCNRQNEGGLYVLPYKYPTRCVTRQVCSLENPFLYINQGFA